MNELLLELYPEEPFIPEDPGCEPPEKPEKTKPDPIIEPIEPDPFIPDIDPDEIIPDENTIKNKSEHTIIHSFLSFKNDELSIWLIISHNDRNVSNYLLLHFNYNNKMDFELKIKWKVKKIIDEIKNRVNV